MLRSTRRTLSFFEGRTVKSEELVKKQSDWVIEETNFCLGRMGPVQFREEDDPQRRHMHPLHESLPPRPPRQAHARPHLPRTPPPQVHLGRDLRGGLRPTHQPQVG
jgi:hypothetical protein